MEIQSIIFTAGNLQQTFLSPAKNLEIIDAAYPISIRFFDREGNALVDDGITNAEAGIFLDMAPDGWGSMVVTSSAPQTVRLLIGSTKGGSRRQPGVVQVVDGGRARTIAGLAFGGYAFQAALAANSALVQLWNPAGSGRRVIVERVSPVTDTNNGAWFATGVAQLATLVGVGVNKLVGGAASTMQIRRANDPTFPTGVPLDAVVLPNSATVIKGYNPVSPVVIPPNAGFTVWSTGPAGIGASFEWVEEVI